MTSKKKRAKNKIKSTNISGVETSDVSCDPNDIFSNPMVQAAQAAMSDEDKEKYKKLGESLFKDINFENGQVESPPINEAVAYIETQIRSGMHISLLEDNERSILVDVYGPEWYLRYNYVEEDVNEIHTLDWEGF
jgi:hypothetical protein